MEFDELCFALSEFSFTTKQVKAPGGSESAIPKTFSQILRPLDWVERQLTAKLVIEEDGLRQKEVSHDTHRVDYVKGRVAFDLEWNSKDQTFDRDLYAFRAFFDYEIISVAVLVTRSSDLDPYFASLGRYRDRYGTEREYKSKYGASTTHIGKLVPRLAANRSGGCPVLVLGITRALLRE